MARKTSALSGKSPIAPRRDGTEPSEKDLESTQSDASKPDSTGLEKLAPEPEKKKKKKVSFYQYEEDKERAMAAWQFTMGHTGHTTVTSFYEAAIREYVLALEAKYNDSKPF